MKNKLSQIFRVSLPVGAFLVMMTVSSFSFAIPTVYHENPESELGAYPKIVGANNAYADRNSPADVEVAPFCTQCLMKQLTEATQFRAGQKGQEKSGQGF